MRVTRCALAISGLDPSGGAGLYADLRGFAAAGVWGCGAVSVVTVQSTVALLAAYPVSAHELLAQVREIARHQRVCSIKLGALGSAANARALRRWLQDEAPRVPVVLDPVMGATHAKGGARLLARSGLRALLALLPVTTVITPNTREAEALLGHPLRSLADTERAALSLVTSGARAALIKGGHARPAGATVVDVLAVGARTYHLESPRRRGEVHGTGCMLASLIAGKLAAGRSDSDRALVEAVRWAKAALVRSRAQPRNIGEGQWVLA